MRARFAMLTGWLLFLGCVPVMVGWLIHWPVWADLTLPGSAMVFNTALCLTLGGVALALPGVGLRAAGRVRTALGCVIAAIALLALLENILALDFGIDAAALHTWFVDSNPHPGRMAPNTALALLLGGAALAGDVWTGTALMDGALRRALPAAVISIGLLGLGTYAFRLDLAHAWFGVPRMALPTGVAIVVFGLGLWQQAYGASAEAPETAEGEVRIYAFFGVAMTLLGTVAIISYGSINGLLERIRWVEHSYQVRVEFEEVMDVYNQARSNWRAYILDDQPAGAAAFQRMAASLPAQVSDVVELTLDNPAQQARIGALRTLIGNDITALSTGLARRQREGPAASAEVFASVSLDVTQANALAAEFRAAEGALLRARQEESRASTRSTVSVIIAGTIAGLALLCYAVWILKRHNDQRTRSVQQLARTNAFLDSLFENIPNMLFVKDAAELRFVRFNRAGEELLGIGRDELIGKTDLDLFPPSEAEAFRARDRAVLAGGQLVDIPEETIHTRHHGPRILHTMKIPVRDAAGTAQYLLGISQDITERRRADEEILSLNASLRRQTERLEAANKELESFSYSVSHDLRAPLRAIDGFALMLHEDYGERLDAEGIRFLEVIRGNARRMGDLIDDLLNLSRLGRLDLSRAETDMDALVGEVVRELLSHHEGRRPRIEIGALPAAFADRVLLRQVWFNLISNAIKYSGKAADPVIEIQGHRGSAECVYSVRDNGAGFSMEYYDKLFGVFQRLHRADEYSGTGVGLAIVQRLVARHGGRVWAQGEVGHGAEFFFTLPVGESDERIRNG